MKRIKFHNLIRSCMFVPGNQPKMLQKSLKIPANVIIPDLEDSVPEGEKLAALNQITEFIPTYTNQRIYPRINSVESNLAERDINKLLNAAVTSKIEGLVLPKLHSYEEYAFIDQVLKVKEREFELEEGKLKLIPWFESPLALMNMKEILSKGKRITAASLGGEDFLWEMGINRTNQLKELEIPRSLFCLQCIAYSVTPLDTPNVDYTEPEKLEKEIPYLKSLGFKGKNAIHPTQVEIINRGFGPSDSEYERARKVVVAFKEAETKGRAALNFEGQMIDVPVYRKALSLVEEYESNKK